MQRKKNGSGATITGDFLIYNYYLKRCLTILQQQEQLSATHPDRSHSQLADDHDEAVQFPILGNRGNVIGE